MLIRVIDFETTGEHPDTGAEVIEVGWCDLNEEGDELGWFESLVKPKTDYWDIGAQAVHHIKRKDVLDNGISWEDAKQRAEQGADIFVAHNADYEKLFFNPEGSVWVDTYKTALILWPEAVGHSNQKLRYWLGFDDLPEERAMPPHAAAPDAYVTSFLLREQMKKASLDQLVEWSREPVYLHTIPFGKHKGQKWEEVPRDYLQWLRRQSDLRPGVVEAIDRVL